MQNYKQFYRTPVLRQKIQDYECLRSKDGQLPPSHFAHPVHYPEIAHHCSNKNDHKDNNTLENNNRPHAAHHCWKATHTTTLWMTTSADLTFVIDYARMRAAIVSDNSITSYYYDGSG